MYFTAAHPPRYCQPCTVECVFILLAHPYVCSPDTSVCMSVDVCAHVSTALAKEVALLLLTDDKWQRQEQITLQEFSQRCRTFWNSPLTWHTLQPLSCLFSLTGSLSLSPFPSLFLTSPQLLPLPFTPSLSPSALVSDRGRAQSDLLTVGSTLFLAPVSRRSTPPTHTNL